MERPPQRYFCNKCGYVGNVDFHPGCGYLAYHLAPFEQNYIDQLERELALLKVSPASAPEGFTMSEPAILPDGSGFGTMTEREAALLGKVAQQSAALKLAREALMHDGYPCGNGCKCRACEALAAIDALGEVK